MKNEEQWKVQINNFDYKLESQVFIYRLIGDLVQYINFDETGIKVISEKRSESAETVKPAFVCRYDEAINIAKAFIEYANSQGFKNGDETFNKGKLEATEKHLEDMRTLVFKKK